jgi:sugar lactone lactonase YvrE
MIRGRPGRLMVGMTSGGVVDVVLSAEPKVLLDGLAMVESPRWHEGRFWFAHWAAGEIVAVDLDGRSEVRGAGPPRINAVRPDHGLGWTIDWLPDGRLLVTGKELLCVEADGSVAPYADLSGIWDGGWNDMVVDGRGNVYVTTIAFEYIAGGTPTAGIIVLVRPDGTARQVAGDLKFPNGMVVTPDNSTLIISESFAGQLSAFDIEADGSLSNRRVWAEGLAPDAICLDADGAIWAGAADVRLATGRDDSPGGAVVRVREGGEVLARVEHDRPIYGCALGGPDRRTLFLLAAEWRGVQKVAEVVAARTGQVLIVPAPAAGAGWP